MESSESLLDELLEPLRVFSLFPETGRAFTVSHVTALYIATTANVASTTADMRRKSISVVDFLFFLQIG